MDKTIQRYSLDRFTLHRRIAMNTKGQDFFVGDIHGYKDKLLSQLHAAGFDFKTDRLFAVGDLIDRGPQSLETLRMFIDEPWAFSVLGNHEWIMVRAQEGDERMQALEVDDRCGGHWRVRYSAAFQKSMADECCKHFPIAMSVETAIGDIGLIHAEPPVSWKQLTECPRTENTLVSWTNWMWSRDAATQALAGHPVNCDGVTAVICGHHTLPQPTHTGNVIFIDTHVSWSGEREFTLLNVSQIEGFLNQKNIRKERI